MKNSSAFIAASLVFQNSVTSAFGAPVAASAKDKTSVANINAYQRDLTLSTLLNPVPARAFVKKSAKKNWQELSKPFTNNQKYLSKARVWVKNGKPVVVGLDQAVKLPISSNHSTLFFRPDGTIAKSLWAVDEISQTGQRIAKIKIQYFDARGKILRTGSATRNLKTGRIINGADFSNITTPLYLKVSTLPFYSLMRK